MLAMMAFDFERKQCNKIVPSEFAERRQAGEYYWRDIGGDAFAQAPQWLAMLGVDKPTIERITNDEQVGHFYVARSNIDFTVVATHFLDDEFGLETLHVVLGRDFMLTLHSAVSPTITGVLETFEEDFHDAAQSAGFLLFEVSDHLIASYRSALGELSNRVEAIQATLLGDAGDAILGQASAWSSRCSVG